MHYGDTALRYGGAGETMDIVLRYNTDCYSVFSKYNCTENMGPCVDSVIWLESMIGQII
jgi:hypothetical protein